MATLSDFNCLWEVSFGLNATFIFFNYLEYREKKLLEILDIGKNELGYHFSETKEEIGGWSYSDSVKKWFMVKYYMETQILKLVGVANTIISILLLVLSAFFSSLSFWPIFSIPLLLLLLGPISYNVFKIHYTYPKAIIALIENAMFTRLEEKQGSLDGKAYEEEKRKIERTIFDIKRKYMYLYFPGPEIPSSYMNDIK